MAVQAPPHTLTERSAVDLARAIRSGETSSREVVEAHIPLGLNQGGLPLGVQAVTAPGNDHVAVAVALELERAHGGWVPPPGLGA
jgi:Asp-tRNA(Asn)/Glu-tRNA(Gln) amidotransferase A subunit family amidase